MKSRKRRRNGNEDDSHQLPRSKMSKSDVYQDSLDTEFSSNNYDRSSGSVNYQDPARRPESSLNQIVAEPIPNSPRFICEEADVCQGSYVHINQILKEAHFYSLQQRGHSFPRM
ncbi:protein VCF1-like [Tenrec ecaudatus]|uniref:protein VCF1-like n=1 Tax=Tenrec ecaudatus TaxID=94439 RepID=UPI003F5A51AC